MSVNLEEKIVKVLTEPVSELWFPQLTHDLVQAAWLRLIEEIGLNKSSYSTVRVLLKDPIAMRKIISHVMFKQNQSSPEDTILIEELPEAITHYYQNSGVNFYNSEHVSSNGSESSEILYCLRDAFNIIRQVPSLLETILHLVKCMHIIKPEADDYDVSFSEPNIPFSVFVSVPQRNNHINSLRVAEAIIHEAMHLQLTLIERISKLISLNKNSYYSPWKEEYRTPQGVMHALYVFRVIQQFFISYLAKQTLPNQVIEHIEKRNSEIIEQIASINSFKDCADLTETGTAFVKRLILEKN